MALRPVKWPNAHLARQLLSLPSSVRLLSTEAGRRAPVQPQWRPSATLDEYVSTVTLDVVHIADMNILIAGCRKMQGLLVCAS